jgi:hypothetical protein
MAQVSAPTLSSAGQRVPLTVREMLYHEKVLKELNNPGEGALASVWQQQQLAGALDQLSVRTRPPRCTVGACSGGFGPQTVAFFSYGKKIKSTCLHLTRLTVVSSSMQLQVYCHAYSFAPAWCPEQPC